MHGRYEDITNVDFTLTKPSQMIRGQGRVANCGLHICASRFSKTYILHFGIERTAPREVAKAVSDYFLKE